MSTPDEIYVEIGAKTITISSQEITVEETDEKKTAVILSVNDGAAAEHVCLFLDGTLPYELIQALAKHGQNNT